MKLLISALPHGRGLALPEQASTGSSGFDLRAALEEAWVLPAGEYGAVPTGLAFAIPPGWEGQVRPRSGLARRHGVTVLNSPGTIDSDYRGEVQVLLINHGKEDFTVERGDRIAQVVFARSSEVSWSCVDQLPATERGSSGFGSSGVK